MMHRCTPKKIVSEDVYGLIATFEGNSMAAAKTHGEKWIAMKLGELESKGVRPSTRMRRKNPKKGDHGRASSRQDRANTAAQRPDR